MSNEWGGSWNYGTMDLRNKGIEGIESIEGFFTFSTFKGQRTTVWAKPAHCSQLVAQSFSILSLGNFYCHFPILSKK